MLLTSMNTGTSGLASASSELAVVSDNLANTNTVGFKSGRAVFEEALAQTIAGGSGDIGLGTRLQAVQRITTQGSLANTGVATDLALQGNGFFVVQGTAGGRTSNFFTRAGQFQVDANGYLSNVGGMRVQGYSADGSGQLASTLGDLRVGSATAQPRMTTEVTLRANLQSDAPAFPAAPPFDPANPSATSNTSTSVTVYDSLGNAHQVQMYFRKTGAGAWEYHALTDGSTQNPVVAGMAEIATGTLAFDASGRLNTVTPGAPPNPFNPAGAVPAQPLAFDFGDQLSVAGGTGLLGVTQFAAASSTSYVGQDGFASGELSQIQIDKNGNVQGVFTNGQTRIIGQVAVASFSAADQLERMGANVYAQTMTSGEPAIGSAGEGGRASITAGALEQSNVDIAEQFVRMIAAQRSFQANSKTITTADQLLAELIQLKR